MYVSHKKQVIIVANVHLHRRVEVSFVCFNNTRVTENQDWTKTYVLLLKSGICRLYAFVIPVSYLPTEMALELNATCVHLGRKSNGSIIWYESAILY